MSPTIRTIAIMTTYLYDAKTGKAHAYTTDGENYYLDRGGVWWAYESSNYLFDAKSGRAIAYWSDDHLYDARTGDALWYRSYLGGVLY